MNSYTWLEKSPSADVYPLINNALNDQRVRESVDVVLGGKNRQKVTADKADFLVTYRLVMWDSINPHSSMGVGLFGGTGCAGCSGNLGLGGTIGVSQYQETELFVDMLDPKTSALIWRGSIKYPTRSSLTPDERAEEIRQKIILILSKFPPQ